MLELGCRHENILQRCPPKSLARMFKQKFVHIELLLKASITCRNFFLNARYSAFKCDALFYNQSLATAII